MRRQLRRETLIALRARRRGHEIARVILNPHLDVTQVRCHRCGHDLPIAPSPPPAVNDAGQGRMKRDAAGPRPLATSCPACGARALPLARILVRSDPHESTAPPDSADPTRRHYAWDVLVTIGMLLLLMLFGFALVV